MEEEDGNESSPVNSEDVLKIHKSSFSEMYIVYIVLIHKQDDCL